MLQVVMPVAGQNQPLPDDGRDRLIHTRKPWSGPEMPEGISTAANSVIRIKQGRNFSMQNPGVSILF